MLRNKKILILISLLVAIGLWMYVMGNVDPEIKDTITGVKVEMQGQDSLEEVDLHATLNSPEVITVTIKGKRSQVNKAKNEGVQAYIDVSTCDYGKNTTDIHLSMPEGVSGISVEKMSRKEATFTVE